ncbi:Metallo-hydrolase/oxidoreductase [Phellopilus nigrolimitatus]|nr:Metallo-hydrolase/oxidoreductase [Phellopilus nigrolimitatus]
MILRKEPDHIRVFTTTEEAQRQKAVSESRGGERPAHWVNDRGTHFRNPWLSFHDHSFWEVLKLGHACFLIELPVHRSESPPPSRGARILFDPVFSGRCSLSQYIGPSRFTKIPCEIEQIPEVDAVVISHNHYDHLDTHTITTLAQRARPPHIFASLGNEAYFRSIGLPSEKVHTLHWWEGRRVEVALDGVSGSRDDKDMKVAFDVTCTPSQHKSGRSMRDHYKSLWASWVIQEVLPTPSPSAVNSEKTLEGVKVYFAGDTGYCTVSGRKEDEDEDALPTCPAFKEIGSRWGGFDFAMIPIGAYKPRDFMSPIHCAPQDSVRVFQDVRAKKALGIYWGTWVLTTEGVLKPPIRLVEECKVGIPEGNFGVCDKSLPEASEERSLSNITNELETTRRKVHLFD